MKTRALMTLLNDFLMPELFQSTEHGALGTQREKEHGRSSPHAVENLEMFTLTKLAFLIRILVQDESVAGTCLGRPDSKI